MVGKNILNILTLALQQHMQYLYLRFLLHIYLIASAIKEHRFGASQSMPATSEAWWQQDQYLPLEETYVELRKGKGIAFYCKAMQYGVRQSICLTKCNACTKRTLLVILKEREWDME